MLFKYLFVHRYVMHPLEQFVDLLTLTNVSIMLLEDTYAGYYLHGKSLMTHADTSLMELNIQMRKEMEMQVDARGFVTTGERRDLKENQCFEMYITEVRESITRCSNFESPMSRLCCSTCARAYYGSSSNMAPQHVWTKKGW